MSASYPPPYQPAPLQNSNTALLSLIAGIAGLTIFPGIGSIIAVVLGHMAKNEIARSGGALGGAGAAQWGLILGYVGIALSVLGVCIFGTMLALGLCAPFLLMLSNPGTDSNSWLPLLIAAL